MCTKPKVPFLSPFTEGLNQYACPRARRSLPGHRRAAEPIGSGVGAASNPTAPNEPLADLHQHFAMLMSPC